MPRQGILRKVVRLSTVLMLLFPHTVTEKAYDEHYCRNATVVLSVFRNEKLTSVPDEISLNTTVLDLSHNRLIIITDYVFHRLNHLQQLYLSKNRINSLEPRSFFGLDNLCYLDLGENPLSTKSFPEAVFSSLTNLKVLNLENTFDSNQLYPDQTFQYLVNLQRLSLPAVHEFIFGPGFGTLQKLEELYIVHGSARRVLNNTFTVFTNTRLRHLSIIRCRLLGMETGSFTSLKHLTSLSISDHRELSLSVATSSLTPFEHRNMTDIIFEDLNHYGGCPIHKDCVLDTEKGKYFSTICVSNLDLGGNLISYIERGFFASFIYPDCLKTLSLRNHRLTVVTVGFIEILRFQHLQYLDVKQFCSTRPLRSMERRRESLHNGDQPRLLHKRDILIHSFPNITYVDMSCILVGIDPAKQFTGTKKLLFLDISYTKLHICRIPLLYTSTIKVLNISGVDCPEIPVDFLQNLPSLQVLEMNSFNLNLGLLESINGHFFERQVHLTSLSLADNGMTNMPKDLFVHLKSTTFLNLANNKLKEIPNTVRHLEALQFLDMSYNTITFVDKSDRIWLEKMSKTTNISVSIEGNPFSCTCSTVMFTRWILETDVNIVAKEKLRCTLTNGTVVDIVALKDSLTDFEIGCKSKFWLIFSVTTASLMCIGLVLCIIGYRYRFNIKYWILTKCRQPRNYEVLPDFDYDAFVAYNHHDYRWVCHRLREFLENQRGYRLCLHHRDFLAGESIQQNIVDSINASRKTILVISFEFLRCDWGEFEIQMAGMRMVQEGRENVVVVILLEDIPVGQMPRSLINMWKNVTFLLWNDEPVDEVLFWERLDQAIRRP